MNALVEAYGFAGQSYAVLSFDARGHGKSGGLVSIDGPREIADTRAVHAWLAARPDVADAKIGAWGISYGGGAVFNSLVAGVPWGAVVTVETWTDLYAALMPQGLVKSGLVAGLAGSIPEAKRDPSLTADAGGSVCRERRGRSPLGGGALEPLEARLGHDTCLHGAGSPRLPVRHRPGGARVQAPQGAEAALSRSPRARTLDLSGGRHRLPDGPGARLVRLPSGTERVLATDRRHSPWRPEGFTSGQLPFTTSQPGTTSTSVAFPGVTTFARTGKSARTSARLGKAIEIYGSPTVKATIAASGGWSRLVAVLTARTPQGKEIVVSAGGVPTRNGVQKVSIKLASQATFVPRGSRLTLTLGSSSLAQSSSNLLYLDLPMAPERTRPGRERGARDSRSAQPGYEVSRRVVVVALVALVVVGRRRRSARRRIPASRPPPSPSAEPSRSPARRPPSAPWAPGRRRTSTT